MTIGNLIQPALRSNLCGAINQMRNTAILLFFFATIVLFPWKTAQAVDFVAPTNNPIKWHPGHYVTLVYPGPSKPAYMENVYQELADYPALRGVTIRFRWPDLEPTKGSYDFSSISNHLKALAARKKRLIILIELRSSVQYGPPELVPEYLKAAAYEGGIFPFSGSRSTAIKGYNIKLWNAQVHERFAALVRKLGERFNSHPYFEGIGLTETSIGKPITPLTGAQFNGYYKNIISINQQMRMHFPNTMVFQFMNYPRDKIPSFVNNMKKTGIALGCPDIFLEETGLFYDATKTPPEGIYSYYPGLSGVIPLTVQIEESNYENTRYDNKGYQPTLSELLTFAKQNLKINYLFWTRSPDYFPGVLELMSMKNQRSNTSGGLNTACPSSYFSCVN